MRKLFFSTVFCILLINCISFAQSNIYNLVLSDSLNFQNTAIINFKILNYNDDDYCDYYVVTNSKSYLIDGNSRDTIWSSFTSEYYKNENLEFIESLGIWRNYTIEFQRLEDSYYNNLLTIKWFNLPDSTPADSNIIVHHGLVLDQNDLFHVGYVPFPNSGSYYAIIDGYTGAIENDTQYGAFYAFNIATDSLIADIDLGYSPHMNIVLGSEGNYFLIHQGNYSVYYNQSGEWSDYGMHRIYNNNFDQVLNYYIPTLFYSTDISIDQDNEYYSVIITATNNLYCFHNIFDTGTFTNINIPFSRSYANYITINNLMKIIIISSNGYAEIYDMDLNFDGYIENEVPNGLSNIKTEDIDSDGTDEIFCIYDSIVRIYKLEDAVGIDETIDPLPYTPLSNYPNPFNIYTMISYHLQAQAEVKLEIYDILGRKIETLVNSTQPAGNHQAIWNADDVPSGVYFYKLTTDEHTQTKKMVLTK